MTNEEICQKIKENDAKRKLMELERIIKNDSRFTNLEISEPNYDVLQDPTIWISGFHNDIRIQLKMQLTGKTVKVNLRPFEYNIETRERFKHQMQQAGYRVSDAENRIYSPTADDSINDMYPFGFYIGDIELIKSYLLGGNPKSKVKAKWLSNCLCPGFFY